MQDPPTQSPIANDLQAAGSGKPASRERSLDRVIEMLEFLHINQHPISVGELAKQLGAPRSTIYNLTRALVNAGLLATYANGRKVYFGKLVHTYGMDYMRENDLLRGAREAADNLARETGETAELCVLQNRRYTIIHSSLGARPFRFNSAVGRQIPLPWTASGRLLLAQFTKAEIIQMVTPEDLVLPDGRTIALDEFMADIAAATAAGYCVTSGLVDAYTKCLAAPIYESRGVVAATLCLVVPIDTSRERLDELIVMLRAQAARLSRQ